MKTVVFELLGLVDLSRCRLGEYGRLIVFVLIFIVEFLLKVLIWIGLLAISEFFLLTSLLRCDLLHAMMLINV